MIYQVKQIDYKIYSFYYDYIQMLKTKLTLSVYCFNNYMKKTNIHNTLII